MPPITPTHIFCGYWFKTPVTIPEDVAITASIIELNLSILPAGYGIDIGKGCLLTHIVYTTQQMQANETQTLTVAHADAYSSYTWGIISGGGSLSSLSGTSTIYTAPSANVDCASNPVIGMYAEGVLCDSLSIAVNAHVDITNHAWVTWEHIPDCWPLGGYPYWTMCGVYTYRGYCDGTVAVGFNPCGLSRYCAVEPHPVYPAGCDTCRSEHTTPGCLGGGEPYNELVAGSPYDIRTPAVKAYGCCPEQLL